uniref:Uncharacterized protein n=1 Tax=Heterorhabditis bacteriophora TaxID=37862 RepID=A0A1I7WAB5_HETBA
MTAALHNYVEKFYIIIRLIIRWNFPVNEVLQYLCLIIMNLILEETFSYIKFFLFSIFDLVPLRLGLLLLMFMKFFYNGEIYLRNSLIRRFLRCTYCLILIIFHISFFPSGKFVLLTLIFMQYKNFIVLSVTFYPIV